MCSNGRLIEVNSGRSRSFTIVQPRERAQVWLSESMCVCVSAFVCTRAQQACLSSRGKHVIGGRRRQPHSCTCAAAAVRRRR